jgi:DNA processing protein
MTVDKSEDLIYLAALSTFPKFGARRLSKLRKAFPDYRSAFYGDKDGLEKAGLPRNLIQEFLSQRPNINLKLLEKNLQTEDIKLIDTEDPAYSKLLSEIYDPPAILYTKGNMALLKERSIALVGTRQPTPYGRQATERLSRELAQAGFCIVSGLALGTDSVAHLSALEARGQTIGVLGSGVDRKSIYPAANRYLAERMISEGSLLISEFPLGTIPLKHNFPMRNRIIAGLSLATIVTEAAIRSGALITAREAMEQGREVFALPGNIFSPVSEGPHKLLSQGANLVTKSDDILEALDFKRLSSYISNVKPAAESPSEEKILTALSREALHIDELKRLSGLDISLLSSTLILLEIRGAIRNLGANRYIIN